MKRFNSDQNVIKEQLYIYACNKYDQSFDEYMSSLKTAGINGVNTIMT